MTSCKTKCFHFQDVDKWCREWNEHHHKNVTYKGFAQHLDHVKCIVSWTTMACHVYDLAYYKVMTIVIFDMQSKDIETQQIVWKKLHETMLKNRFSKPNFKGLMVDSA